MLRSTLLCLFFFLSVQHVSGKGKNLDSLLKEIKAAHTSMSEQSSKTNAPGLSLPDSLYNALQKHHPHSMLRDTALWRHLSRDYLASFPVPCPEDFTTKGHKLLLLSTKCGIPFVRRIIIDNDTLLVTVHYTSEDPTIVVSYWRQGDSTWEQCGRNHVFETNEDPEGAAIFVGDSGNTCIAIGAYRGMFGLYRLGLDSMPCVYAETLTTDTARYVGFYEGDHAGRFGCFAAETRKLGTGGWEELFLFYWNDSACVPIPVSGVGDAAIAKNHISECFWLEPEDALRPPYAELCIARQYIKVEALPSRVYRFDGAKWSHVSFLHTPEIVKSVKDERYRNGHLLLYDSAFAMTWIAHNTDTLQMHASRIQKYCYKMSNSRYIGKLFHAGLYYFSRNNWDSAFTIIRMLHTPWGGRDNTDLTSARQLETIKSYLVSCGDMTFCGFADSLFSRIRSIKDTEMGENIAEVPSIRHGPLPHARLTAFVDSLWPHAFEETRRLRLYRCHGKDIMLSERKLHDSLSTIAGRITGRHAKETAARFWNTLRKWYTGKEMQFFMLAEKDADVREAFRACAYSTVRLLLEDVVRSGPEVLPADIIHGALLNYCRPVHDGFFKKHDLPYTGEASCGNARLVTYGLSMGDSSALRIVESFLSRREPAIDSFAYSLFNPKWGAGPVSSACAFGFESVWTLRPTAETLTNLAPGVANAFFMNTEKDEENGSLRKVMDLLGEADDPSLKYMFIMFLHMETLKAMHGSGLYTDKVLRKAGLNTDTLYAIVDQVIQTGKRQDGFDIRDIMSGLEKNGRSFVDWAIANKLFDQNRQHWIELMMACGLGGYDSLMIPFVCDSVFTPPCRLSHPDICYLLRYGSKKNRKKLLKSYRDTSGFKEVEPYFRLSLMRSGKKIAKLIDSLSLYDPDTLDTEHWRDVEWAPNDYLMLVPNKKVNKHKWRYLYIFDSFATDFAAKTWYYHVLVNEFRDGYGKKDIISRVNQYDFPWEFAYDIMKINDLQEHAASLAKKHVASEFDMYWENPLMEQVLANRMLRSGDYRCLIRFLPRYNSSYTVFMKD